MTNGLSRLRWRSRGIELILCVARVGVLRRNLVLGYVLEGEKCIAFRYILTCSLAMEEGPYLFASMEYVLC